MTCLYIEYVSVFYLSFKFKSKITADILISFKSNNKFLNNYYKLKNSVKYLFISKVTASMATYEIIPVLSLMPIRQTCGKLANIKVLKPIII